MADDFLDTLATSNSTLDAIRQANYEKYKDKFKDSTEDLVNSETFLNLMVAEMTNQDPLEPTSNTEFITQLAGFSQLSYMKDSSKYALANYASSLVGKTVTAQKPAPGGSGKDVVTKTGVVESVSKQGDTYNLTIDGEMYDISKVIKVEPSSGESSSTISSSALADSIARASGMIGMYATAKTDDGVSVGWIDTIKVKDGKISAVIVDQDGTEVGEFALDTLTEVTYATIGTGNPDNSAGDTGKPDDTTDNTDKVDDVEKPDTPPENTDNSSGDVPADIPGMTFEDE